MNDLPQSQIADRHEVLLLATVDLNLSPHLGKQLDQGIIKVISWRYLRPCTKLAQPTCFKFMSKKKQIAEPAGAVDLVAQVCITSNSFS